MAKKIRNLLSEIDKKFKESEEVSFTFEKCHEQDNESIAITW